MGNQTKNQGVIKIIDFAGTIWRQQKLKKSFSKGTHSLLKNDLHQVSREKRVRSEKDGASVGVIRSPSLIVYVPH
jgi:hypothetical protein